MSDQAAPQNPNVAVLIPALNEADRVAETVAVARELDRAKVFVVDNGSADDTAECALQAGARVITCPEIGKAQAVRSGLSELVGSGDELDVVLLLDADLTGLRLVHLQRLLAGLDAPSTEMSCGVLWRSRVHRLMLHVPLATFTGQRAIRFDVLRRIDLSECEGYELEATISRQVKARRTARIAWEDVGHTRRERRANKAWASPTRLPPALAGPWMRLSVLMSYIGIVSRTRRGQIRDGRKREDNRLPAPLGRVALLAAWLSR